ncbi:MAG: hypothetical protein WCD37_11965 [Chloroflexia bacterium]
MVKPSVDEIRAVAAQIVERANRDPQFMEQLRNDPETVLLDAGLHESAVGDFMRSAGLMPEVQGYILEDLDVPCQYSCLPNTHGGIG